MEVLKESIQSKPAPTIEGLGRSSKENESIAPPVGSPLPILIPQIDIDHVRKEYSTEEVLRLNL